MENHCRIPNVIEKIFAASHSAVAYIGGSLTVGVGASDVSRTSWRVLFVEYLYKKYHPTYHCQVSQVMGAVGACESYVGVFTLGRNVLPASPDLAFVEFCVNDRGAPDKDLVVKGMEGIIRQLVSSKNRCEVVLMGMGDRNGSIDHALHREIADHYDLPFIDVQGEIFKKLEERGEAWDSIALEFVDGDPYHLNDYGNQLVFESMRDCFEEQVVLFKEGKRRERFAALPNPKVSDEMQFTKLVDPSKKKSGVSLDGEWELKASGLVPWYYDNILVGRPGSTMTVPFLGTAVCVFGIMYNNGLKIEATLDGKEIAGPYYRHVIEFGKGFVLAHGLENREHVLKLTVGQPSKRHNKLENPTGQIAYIGIASPE